MNATRRLHSVTGHLEQFNLSPKGVPEGMVLRPDAERHSIQVNFEPELASQVIAVVAPGQSVTVEIRPFSDAHPEAHAVYSLIELTGSENQPCNVVADGPAEARRSVKGKIVRLNHARRGEVNGAILDSGEFVHLKPHGVKAVGGLRIGDTLAAVGEVRAGWQGTCVIEAIEANGVAIGKPPHKHPHPPHHPHGKPPADRPLPRPAGKAASTH